MKLLVGARFSGPPGAANGGYAAGLLAREIGGRAEVTIRRRIPLDVPLDVVSVGDGVVLRGAAGELAEARPVSLEVEPPGPVPFEEAGELARSYPGFEAHPIPRCFVCGPERPAGDGLRIFPGIVRDGLVAAPWVPEESLADGGGVVSPEFLWAALDCPGAFAVNHPPRGLALLGRLAAEVLEPVRAGERLVIVGWRLGAGGRKLHPGTAIFDEAGRVRAVGRATWILLEEGSA